MDKDLKRNASGYTDPTAYRAMRNVEREEKRVKKLLATIYNVCELSGYRVESRIVLKDVNTGREWR